MDVRIVYITCGSQEEARDIGATIVEERLAACANILPGMIAVFRWEGAIQSEEETVLLLKTREELVRKLTERVTALHSYDCPCVAALPVMGGHKDFFAWIGAETQVDDLPADDAGGHAAGSAADSPGG